MTRVLKPILTRALALPALLALSLLAGCAGQTTPVTNVTATSATLNASASCGGGGQYCWWDWGYRALPSGTWQYTPLTGPVGNETGSVGMSANIGALTPGTTYEVELCGAPDRGTAAPAQSSLLCVDSTGQPHGAGDIATNDFAATTFTTLSGTTTSGTSPMFGVTVDDVSQISSVVFEDAAGLPDRPTTRVAVDSGAASDFASAIAQLHAVSNVMVEILDSADMANVSDAQVDSDTRSYTSAFGGNADIWEVGDEVNGNWTGSYSSVEQKVETMYQDVKAANANAQTALTLYYNNPSGARSSLGPNCGDGTAELTPEQFTQQYVPAAIADSLNYVLLSYYPTQCGGYEPSSAEVAEDVSALHALYPNAQIGFGEVGLPSQVSGDQSQAEQIMQWVYSLNPGLPYYMGGYFWWYGAEDVYGEAGGCGCMLSDLSAAFTAEAHALGG